MTNNVASVYLITNAFGTYIIYRFMRIFFDVAETDKKVEAVSYLLYFFTIGLLFIAFNNSTLNVFANLIMFFLITFNYEAALRKRITVSISIYVILAIIELSVVLPMQYYDITIISKDSDLKLMAALITIKIITYNIMLLLSNFKRIKNDVKVSVFHWLSIFIIPAGTLILALMMVMKANPNNLTGIITSVIILFIINLFIFYLYDFLIKSYDEKMENALLQQQNYAYLEQLEIINQSKENLRVFSHDMKNHMLSIKTLIENNESEKALDYLNSVFKFTDITNEYSKSGNFEIDSILNYKLHNAKSLGINTDISINVPERLNILPFDLSVVLGNLLDNAVEAVCKCDEKIIKIMLELDRNVLYISISNSFAGNLHYDDGVLATTKCDKQNHGMGIKSVMKSLEKYNGAMEIHHNGNMFFVDVLIYNCL
ncbi:MULTISPECIES: sensor histidine kinase [unclassified Sedimentibacter]|uniref:sensor histidine kinase n=1 Tax=unclassified Sedimentibacter TaxID=2649220 RepID=UPI0027E1B364|nr:sensor histidine kinase [Sedimentibacter sp. MB35-C1]WMJ78918.1 GHKL domain-containing protein [Sedimentibacter sp. MB35-C1]